MKNIFLVFAMVLSLCFIVACGNKSDTSNKEATSGNGGDNKSGDVTTVNVHPIDISANGSYVSFLLDADVGLMTSDVTSNSGEITIVQMTSTDIDINGEVGTPGKQWWKWSVHFASPLESVTITINKKGYTFVPSTLSF